MSDVMGNVMGILNEVNRLKKIVIEERALKNAKSQLNSIRPPVLDYDRPTRYGYNPYAALAQAVDIDATQLTHLMEAIVADPERGDLVEQFNQLFDYAILIYPEALEKTNEARRAIQEAHKDAVKNYEIRKATLEATVETLTAKFEAAKQAEAVASNDGVTAIFNDEEAVKIFQEQWQHICGIFIPLFKNQIDLTTQSIETQRLACSIAGNSKYYTIKDKKVAAAALHPGATGEEVLNFNVNHVSNICFELSLILGEPLIETSAIAGMPRVANKTYQMIAELSKP